MEAKLVTPDGTSLHLRRWPCAGGRGTFLIVHGLGEHSGRYDQLAAHLNALGWPVVCYDQRGHGLSAGARGRLPHAEDLLLDLTCVIDALRADGNGPLVLLGHSMGGSVAGRFVAEGLNLQPSSWYRAVSALVLSSPAFDPGMNAAQRLLLAVLAPLAPDLAMSNAVNPQWLSHDPQVVRAYIGDALVHDRVTPRLARFIVDSGRLVLAQAPNWTTPTLLLYAGSDRLVSPAGSAAFAARAPVAVVRTQAFPALYHEIFNETARDEVVAALNEWLAARADYFAV